MKYRLERRDEGVVYAPQPPWLGNLVGASFEEAAAALYDQFVAGGFDPLRATVMMLTIKPGDIISDEYERDPWEWRIVEDT